MTSDKQTDPAFIQGIPRKLLYVTDCVDDSEEALDLACALAKDNGAHLELLHVIDPGHSPSRPDAQMEIQFRLETLARSLKLLKDKGDAVLLYGAPEEVILKRAAEIHPTLIAFPLNGTVTDDSKILLVRRLIRRCPFPVLTLLPRFQEEGWVRRPPLNGLAAFIANVWEARRSRVRGRPRSLTIARSRFILERKAECLSLRTPERANTR